LSLSLSLSHQNPGHNSPLPIRAIFPSHLIQHKVPIQIRSRPEFQTFPASFRTTSYDNFLTSVRRIPVEHNTGFILIQIVPLHACYMFRAFLRPSSDMSI
jgi:hypothetical protein